MIPTLDAGRVLTAIEQESAYISGLKAHIAESTAKLHKHAKVLTRLKARARCTGTNYFKRCVPKIDKEAGVERHGFITAAKYGVPINGPEWFLTFGQNSGSVAKTAIFIFSLKLDKNIQNLINAYEPKALVRGRCHNEIICEDIPTALMLTRLFKRPKLIHLETVTKAGARAAHRRLYTRKSLRGISLCRRIKD